MYPQGLEKCILGCRINRGLHSLSIEPNSWSHDPIVGNLRNRTHYTRYQYQAAHSYQRLRSELAIDPNVSPNRENDGRDDQNPVSSLARPVHLRWGTREMMDKIYQRRN